MGSDWQNVVETKRDSILGSIPQKWRLQKIPSATEQKDVTGSYIQQFLTPNEVEITETDAVGLASKIASGSWTAVAVTEAFCHRASLAHQMVNCLHETFFEAAVADAELLDAYLKEHGKTKGALHGVPVSLKDQFHVKDVDTSMGYAGWIDTFEGKKDDARKRVYESELVRELRDLGAVLYCKTSVPYTLMCGETLNNIIGYTWNPKNRNLSSGGSSGGEGALIGLRGSPLGLGTDIGGSIRIPAGFNGLYGLRPTVGRLPYEGMANSMDGQNSVLSVVGPLGTSAGSIKLITKAILSQSPWLFDPLVVEMPWRSAQEQEIIDIATNVSKERLCFAVLKSDGFVNPLPPVIRAMSIVTKVLENAGHKIIEWDPPSHSEGIGMVLNSWLYDGGKDVHGAFALSGEKIAPQILGIYGEAAKEEFTASQISANNLALRQYRKKYLDYWMSTASATGTGKPVDAVIAPLAPYPAARPGKYGYYGYTVIVNGLNYTSVAVPVTNVDKHIDQFDGKYTPLNEDDKKAYGSYDAELYDGAHVSVQLIGRSFQEEKMIAIADLVGGMLNK